MFRCALSVKFRDFRENNNFRETRKSRKFDLEKLAKLAKISRNTWAFSWVSCFAKILERVSSKTLLISFTGDLFHSIPSPPPPQFYWTINSPSWDRVTFCCYFLLGGGQYQRWSLQPFYLPSSGNSLKSPYFVIFASSFSRRWPTGLRNIKLFSAGACPRLWRLVTGSG
jgi:hypothetical protein